MTEQATARGSARRGKASIRWVPGPHGTEICVTENVHGDPALFVRWLKRRRAERLDEKRARLAAVEAKTAPVRTEEPRPLTAAEVALILRGYPVPGR